MSNWTPAPRKALKGLREVRVHFGTFDFPFYCVAGPWADFPDYVAWRHRESANWLRGRVEQRGLYVQAFGKPPIVWIPRCPRTPREIGTLAHEVLHIVKLMGEWAGIHFGEDTQEVFCHALGHGVTTILTELRKKEK